MRRLRQTRPAARWFAETTAATKPSEEPPISMTDKDGNEIISERVIRIADEILTLNVVEAKQLSDRLAVCARCGWARVC